MITTDTVVEEERRGRLEQRLLDYHGVGIEDVLGVLDCLRGDRDTVIVGGSLAYDLGNRLSDFDVLICGPDTDESRTPLAHRLKTLRVDLWTRSHIGVDLLFGQAEQALADELPVQGAFGGPEEERQLKLLHRVAFGLRIDGPPLRPGVVRDPRRVARDLLVREYAERMRESALIAQLAGRRGDRLAAAANARQAVEECLHAVLAARGVPFTGDKWLQERLRSVAPDLRAHHDRFSALPGADEDAGPFVAGAVALCGELTGRDLTVTALAPDLIWSVPDVRLASAGGGLFLVAPGVGGLWELTPAEAETWRGLEERSAVHDWRGSGCGRAETDLLVGLYACGLAELDWDRGLLLSELEVAR